MSHFFALVGFLLAALLLASGATKLRGRFGRDAAVRSALGKVVRSSTVLIASWRALAAVEALLAVTLVVAPARVGGALAAAFFVAAAVYAGAALRLAPERPCGCFGASADPVSRRVLVRALLLAAAAGLYAGSDVSTSSALSDGRAWLGLLVVFVLFLALSPEPLMLLRRLAAARIPGCVTSTIDADVSVEVLRKTATWRSMAEYVVNEDPSGHWREGCWQLFSFDASFDEKAATAVFALRLPPGRSKCRARLHRGVAGVELLTTADERVRWPVSARRRREKAPEAQPA